MDAARRTGVFLISTRGETSMATPLCSRRHILQGSTMSLGSLALAWLLKQDRLLADAPIKPDLELHPFDLLPKAPHHPPRAQAMISLFMIGGPSHHDLFDRKPLL